MKDKTRHQIECKAEATAAQTLDTVHEIFGKLISEEAEPLEDEPVLIRQWRNGGLSRLKRRLREGDFDNLPVLKVADNA
jgi:hypothetical protein